MKKENLKALLAFSGGLDSTVLLAKIINSYEVSPILFSYGTKQDAMQFNAVRNICSYYCLEFEKISLPLEIVHSTSMADGSSEGVDTVKSSTIPCRNLVFASVLASIAVGRGIQNIFMGLQDGMNSSYKDCHPDFIRRLQETIDFIIDPNVVSLNNPMLFLPKNSIVKQGKELGVPFELTRTCYTGQNIACGKCPACIKRLDAFKLCEIEDPIQYKNPYVENTDAHAHY